MERSGIGSTLDRLVGIIRREQFDPEKGPPSIRRLARLTRRRQRDVLQDCEDADLNVNIGIQCGSGFGVFDRIGDYTVEDLTVDANATDHRFRWTGDSDMTTDKTQARLPEYGGANGSEPPVGSVLTVDGWIPPEQQHPAVRAGVIVGSRCAEDAIRTTMAVINRSM